MCSDYRIMLRAVREDRKFWIIYILACFVALFWAGYSAAQGTMIIVAMVIVALVCGCSVILCLGLISDLKQGAHANTRPGLG